MKKAYILVLAAMLGGCNSQSQHEASTAMRRTYVENHIAEIRKANRELLVSKAENFLTWRPSIDSIAERKADLMEVIIRAMCGENTDMLVSELMEFAPAGEATDEAVADLKAGLEALSRAADANMCRIFEEAILRGDIVEGMTTKQVETALGRELAVLWSDASGDSIYEVRDIEQENYILRQGKLVIAATTLSMEGHSSDFYLRFKKGKLADWVYVPHVGSGL